MLEILLKALPAIFGSMLLIALAYFVSRWVGNFAANVLTGVGFDRVLSLIGLKSESVVGQQTPSQIVGYLTTVVIMVFAIIEASEFLDFTILTGLVTQLAAIAGGMLVAVVVFGLGLYLAGLVDRVIRSTAGEKARILDPVARVAIIVFSGALALRQTGIAEYIVNMAFALVLGAMVLAIALAFGLSSREIAAREFGKLAGGSKGFKPAKRRG